MAGFGPRSAQLTVARIHGAPGDAALAALHASGLKPLPVAALQWRDPRRAPDIGEPWSLPEEAAFADFWAEQVPRLQAAGWQVSVAPGFAHFTAEVQRWHLTIDPAGGTEALHVLPKAERPALPRLSPLAQPKRSGSWLLSLGVEVEGELLDLTPMVARLLREDRRWLDPQALHGIGDDERIVLRAPGGRRIHATAAPLKWLLGSMLDVLLAPRRRAAEGQPLALNDWQAERAEMLRAALAESMAERAGAAGAWALQGDAGLRTLVERLRDAGTPPPVSAPRGLATPLRGYQLDGLAWLQQLRRLGLGGVLADEMGLGKTLQVLAHVLLAREAGRLDAPALVVLPTTLVANWQAEAARHAPGLRVLALHGGQRKRHFDRIAGHDLVLTTYTLLVRDRDVLQRQRWSLLVLDEAQFVKNAATRAATAARRLHVQQRLAVTGTPLENHLGELWAQFDFCMPGFLGEWRAFLRHWKRPIEDNADHARAALLARRIRPFVLRRRKEDVAAELPPRSDIVRRVRLEGAQRLLYESVRLAADELVSRVLAEDPLLRRKRVVVLDALLRLRQVCCDPRLVKGGTLPAGIGSAKLELLRQLLPALHAEGRRVVVFSQFATLLRLLADELPTLGLAEHGMLTGRVPPPRRAQVVDNFQAGRVPLLLASLKAGGVGLNLTAADTVIHLDPWWNPAVMEQASARAHRIGQTRPVFVLQVVVEGSIEERMLALQQRKAALAEAVLDAATWAGPRFGERELRDLLAPLPD